jgi:hypothetical protein
MWLSAHLAALDLAVQSVVARELPLMAEQLAAQRALGRDLQYLLREVEQQRSGDALAAPAMWSSERIVLLERLDQHAAGERVLLRSLADTLGPASMDGLLRSYTKAFERGPTRPHLHGPHRGPMGRAMFHVSAWRDHFMDVLDSRKSPARPSRPRQPARSWGEYLLGVEDVEAGPGEDDRPA